MKKLFYPFCLFVLLMNVMIINSVYASPSDDLTRTLNRTRSMQANFTQTTYDNRGKPAQTTKGVLAWVRPGKFRWEAKEPIPQLIIASGKRLWIVDPDLMQVTIRKVKKEIGETPTMLLSDNVIQLEKRFHVTANQQNDKATYTLKPKKGDSTFVVIQLQFNHDKIISMRLVDQLGHTTQIDFSQVVENPALPVSMFQYVPSAQMDVINEG